jgi:hypothetical protein
MRNPVRATWDKEHAMTVKKTSKSLLASAALPLLLVAACGGDGGSGDDSTGDDTGAPDAGTPSQWDEALGARVVDYGQALRIASLKLRGELPTLAEIKFVTEAGDAAAQKMAYEATIDAYLEDPRFAGMMRDFFRDAFKMGGGEMDTAPNFAARLVVEGKPFTDLFTATANTCPTFDRASGAFTDGECQQGTATVGVLTNPNVMRQFFSNMAFRRVRWVQETFVCTKFPAEWAPPVDIGAAAQYTSPWPFESVASPETGGVVNFRDTSAVICANCHTTMNHQAPLFAHFDEDGQYQQGLAVPTPVDGAPTARVEDYLPAGEVPAYRLGQPTPDLAAFGAAMANDPAVAECAVARVWNYALGKGDIVAALAVVPTSVVEAQLATFKAQNYNLKEVIRAVFTSDDFVKF